MQAGITTSPQTGHSLATKIGWFSLAPIATLVLLLVAGLVWLNGYQADHDGRIFTGVSVAAVDLSGLTQAEAEALLAEQFTYTNSPVIVLRDGRSGQAWEFTPAKLGLQCDVAATAAAAFNVGREGGWLGRTLAQVRSWYGGVVVPPVMIFDQGRLMGEIDALGTEIGQIPTDAAIQIDGDEVTFVPSQVGRALDKADTFNRLVEPLSQMQVVDLELLIHESRPRIYDASEAAMHLKSILSGPISFYLQTPVDGVDLGRATIPVSQLREWLRVSVVEDEEGRARYDVFVDEIALRGWLGQYAAQVSREPQNARFYFDDPTQELVLVEPHVNGRELDIEATIAQFNQQVTTPNRSVPFIIKEIVPVVNSEATAAELGIKDLVAERTTWFYGSSAERRHNIARAASNFYGIVIAPGEEFSFNKYLGDISLEDGYESALIILGGQTIEGVGGGVCQVSTTLFQTAFWGGFDIGARQPHGYQVGYYEDGEGTGMDATVFSPLVDFTFTNNTEHYLLIENYYNQEYESLTFKMYSTDIGRVVEKEGPFFENVQDPKPDKWEFNEELAEGEIKQVEWAAYGAEVTVERVVYNFAGDVRDRDTFVSDYIPWGNVYQYGPGVNINNLPRGWQERLDKAEDHTINVLDS